MHINPIRFILLILIATMFSCANKKVKKAPTKVAVENKAKIKIIRSLKISNKKSKINQGDIISLEYKFHGKIDSAFLEFEDKREIIAVGSSEMGIETNSKSKLGSTHAFLKAYKDGESQTMGVNFKLLPSNAPKEYSVVVVSTIPHSTTAYTQGLEFYKGKLYESSGQYGVSYIESKEFPSLKSVKKKYLEPKYFAEGITFFNDKLYLLTWKEHKAFVMNPETLEIEKEFEYSTEGWGLTTDGKVLYMSDGTDKIYKISPDNFAIIDHFEVVASDGNVHSINELEWINGEIWANVYGYNMILRIDPNSGEVKGFIRIPALLAQNDKTADTDVFNGIAFDEKSGKIYVTGKNWPKMFEIKILERK